jgi:hypothetical protein
MRSGKVEKWKSGRSELRVQQVYFEVTFPFFHFSTLPLAGAR